MENITEFDVVRQNTIEFVRISLLKWAINGKCPNNLDVQIREIVQILIEKAKELK